MAKKKNRAKKPKQKHNPSRSKSPNGIEAAKCIPNAKFCWRVDDVDLDGNWGWDKPNSDILFKTIIPKLHNFESMNWAEVEGAENHFISCEFICKDAQNRLKDLNKSDLEEIFSLRISGKQRIFGVRIGFALHLLWWDPKHEVCPSNKKHT